MTCNRNLQGRFVAGRFTPVVLLCASFCMWVAGFIFGIHPFTGVMFPGAGGLLPVVVLMCLVASAMVLGSFTLFERRVRWLPALFLWLACAAPFVSGSAGNALSCFLLVAIAALLFRCQACGIPEQMLYRLFLAAGVASMLSPVFLLILPLLMAAPFVGNGFSLKKLLAMLLGFVTPVWLLSGTAYLFPGLWQFAEPFIANIEELDLVGLPSFSPLGCFMLVAELLVAVPFALAFAGSPVPGKPLLRRRLAFVLSIYIYILLLSFLFGQNELFYTMRLPWLAIMVSYLFVLKNNRLTNIYFIFINILWLSAVPLYLWLN